MENSFGNPIQYLENNIAVNEAVKKLIYDRSPADWQSVLKELFAGWIGSSYNDGLDAGRRMDIYYGYSDLHELFVIIEKAETNKNGTTL
jgi:hypothetical protein